jgi:hypothetical protein
VSAKLEKETRARKALLNKVIEMQGNIRVFCRVRPMADDEKRAGEQAVVSFGEDNAITIGPPASASASSAAAALSGGAPTVVRAESFEFDRVYDQRSTQEGVFLDVAPLVQSCLDGYNVCVFAYGQTGSGKTYTVRGLSTGCVPL